MRTDYQLVMLGKKIGKLTVISLSGKCPRGNLIWNCQCDCGNTHQIQTRNLTRKRKEVSCGCNLHKKGKENPNWVGHKDVSGTMWSRIKRDAEKRDMEFQISMEYVWNLFLEQDKKCAYSGLDLSFGENFLDNKARTASLDRIDSSKGYVEGNVQWVHKDVNFMKQDYSESHFLELVEKIYKYKKMPPNHR